MAFVIKEKKTSKPAKKVAAKKPAPKKPVAKKPVAKKPVAKKPAAASKPAKAAKPVAKKPAPAPKAAAKKPAAKKPIAAKKPATVVRLPTRKIVVNLDDPPIKIKKDKNPNRVPPRIIRKPTVVVKPVVEPINPIDTAKAAAVAQSIAQAMKARSAKIEADKQANATTIRLSRRPTTRKQGKETAQFPEADLKDFRKRLLAERERALSGVNAMKATGFNEAEDHEADGGDGTNQTLRLQALGQMGNINRIIQQIEEALHRIDDGTYGVCTHCGQLIRKPRLVNQPFVLTCMECQSELERTRV